MWMLIFLTSVVFSDVPEVKDNRSCFTKALAASETSDYNFEGDSMFVRCVREKEMGLEEDLELKNQNEVLF